MNKWLGVLLIMTLGAGTFKRPGAAELEGTAWRGVTLTTAGGQVLEGEGTRYQVDFRGEGEVRFKLDCNTEGDSYTASRSVCPEIRSEQVVLAQLGQVRSDVLQNGKLTLLLDNGGRMVWGK